VRGSTRDAATAAVPGVAAYRALRSARRNPGQVTGAGAAGGQGTGARAAQGSAAGAADQDAAGVVAVQDGYPPDLATAAAGRAAGHGAAGNGADPASGGRRPGVAARARSWAASSGDDSGRSAPPLNLPSRAGPAAGPGRGSSGHGLAAGNGAAAGRAGPAGTGGRQAGPPSAPAASPPAAPGWRPAAVARPLASRSAAGPDPTVGATGGRSAAPGRRAAPGHAGASPAGRPASPPAGSATPPAAGSHAAGEKPAPPGPFWLRPIRRQK
jgi:hypothetical protein